MPDLPVHAQRRLEAFGGRLERLRTEDLLILAAAPLDPAAHEAARREAGRVATERGLAEAVDSARRGVDDFVVRLFNNSTVQPGWMEANWGRPGTVADRAKLARSLGDAVTALALEGHLGDDAIGELLGPWASLFEGPGGG